MPFIRIGEMNTHQLVRHLLDTITIRFDTLEDQMSEITGAVGRLQASVTQAVALIRSGSSDQTDKIVALQEALDNERAQADALAASEAAEDVQQNADLQAARDEVNRLTAEITQGAADINAQADALDSAIASRASGVDEPATDGSAGVGDTSAADEPGDTTTGDAPVAEVPETPANDGDGSLPAGDDTPEVPATDEPTPADDTASTGGDVEVGTDPQTGTDGTDGAPATGEVPAETPATGVDEPASAPEAPASQDESGNTTNA